LQHFSDEASRKQVQTEAMPKSDGLVDMYDLTTVLWSLRFTA
jgi:hypothetical protein